jgi:hypothetical protein
MTQKLWKSWQIEFHHLKSDACVMKHYLLVINIEVLQASGFVTAKHFHPSLIFANKARQELTLVETLIGQKVGQIENE